MKFRFRLVEQEGYLLALPEGGDPTTEEWCSASKTMFVEAVRLNTPRILIDRQECSITFDALGAVHVAEFLNGLDLQQFGFRIAVLVNVADAKSFSMLETSMSNRSFAYKVFIDKALARSWLVGE